MQQNLSEENKITLEEYEKKYSSKRSQKKAKKYVALCVTAIGLIILACMFMIFKETYEINEYLGYGVGGLCLILYVFIYIVPVIKIKKLDKFSIDVTGYNAGKAKKKNARIRKVLSEKIVECYKNTEDGSTWYSDKKVKEIVSARNRNDDNALKTALTDIYKTDVKTAATRIIRRCSTRAGMYSALSQNDNLDTVIITSINLQMVKDLLYLYGFRPSEAETLKIFGSIIRAALVSYGMGTVSGNVGNVVGGAVKGIPVLGAVVGTLVDSSVQGIANGTVTAIIGHKTIKYLVHDFNLQNILDSIDIDVSEEDFKLTCNLVRDELKKEQRGKSKSSNE